MKRKIIVLTLAMAAPSVVWASSHFFNFDPVYVISKTDSEHQPVNRIKNYRLVWNQDVGKFDLLPGIQSRPITIEESMNPMQTDPQPNEPVYYSNDLSV